MKPIKYLLLLIITILVAALIYFNQSYFMATAALSVSFKKFAFTIPELPTYAYMGICFLIGLFFAGLNTLTTWFSLNKTIKEQGASIHTLTEQLDAMKVELDVFKHDPYIKKGLENKAAELALEQSDETVPAEETEPVVETAVDQAAGHPEDQPEPDDQTSDIDMTEASDTQTSDDEAAAEETDDVVKAAVS